MHDKSGFVSPSALSLIASPAVEKKVEPFGGLTAPQCSLPVRQQVSMLEHFAGETYHFAAPHRIQEDEEKDDPREGEPKVAEDPGHADDTDNEEVDEKDLEFVSLRVLRHQLSLCSGAFLRCLHLMEAIFEELKRIYQCE